MSGTDAPSIQSAPIRSWLAQVDLQALARARREIQEDSTAGPGFFIQLALSTVIAAYGLLANSTAVVIGAMLIAPLMGPIFGIALALCRNDRRLLLHAGVAEASGVAVVVLLATAIGLVPLRPEFSSEIIARTQPTVYDILIALASGLAGAYARINPRISPSLAGVAIATALVPPLTTCGLCLAARQWDWAWGAFLLYFANYLAIELAATLVFTFWGLARADEPGRSGIRGLVKRVRISMLLLLVAGAWMTRTLVHVVEDQRLTRVVERVLTREVGATVGARISRVETNPRRDPMGVVATVLTPQAFVPDQVQSLQNALQKELRRPVGLVVRSLISRDSGPNGPVYIPEHEQQRRAEAEAEALFLSRLTDAVSRELSPVPGRQLTDVQRGQPDAEGVVEVSVRIETPQALTPAQVRELEERVVARIGTPIRLRVRSVLTLEATAHGYEGLSPRGPEEPPPTGDDQPTDGDGAPAPGGVEG